jgi:hypothetical protein
MRRIVSIFHLPNLGVGEGSPLLGMYSTLATAPPAGKRGNVPVGCGKPPIALPAFVQWPAVASRVDPLGDGARGISIDGVTTTGPAIAR